MKSQESRGAIATEFGGALHMERTYNLHNRKLKKEIQEQGRAISTKFGRALHAKTTQGVAQLKVGQ